MTIEDKFVFALLGVSVAVLVAGTVVSKVLSTAPPRVMRTVWPVAAAVTLACYAALVFIARSHVKG